MSNKKPPKPIPAAGPAPQTPPKPPEIRPDPDLQGSCQKGLDPDRPEDAAQRPGESQRAD